MPGNEIRLDEKFQSTLSVRRATLRQFQHESLHIISIHALRKESDHEFDAMHVLYGISIHALRKESDRPTW